MEDKRKEKNYPIFSATIAKYLINAGCIVKDIKLNNRNEYNNRNGKLHEREDFIIFYFENSDFFQNKLSEQRNQVKAYKESLVPINHSSGSIKKE